MVLDGDCIDERHLMLVVFWGPNVHSMYNLRHVGPEHDCGLWKHIGVVNVRLLYLEV